MNSPRGARAQDVAAALALAALFATSCTTTPQLMGVEYTAVDSQVPVAPAEWARRTAFVAEKGGVDSNTIAVIPDEAIQQARPLSLQARGDGLELTPRDDLCLNVEEQTLSRYQDTDHVGGWKTTGGILAFIGAAGTGAYGAYALAQAGKALPNSAVQGNPYVPQDTKTQEDWRRSGYTWLGIGGALAVTGAIFIASNWWTSREPTGWKGTHTDATLAACGKSRDTSVLFRPVAMAIAGANGSGEYDWRRAGQDGEALAIASPSTQGDLARLLRELLAAKQTGHLSLAVQAEIIHRHAPDAVMPVSPQWRSKLEVTDNAAVRRLLAVAIRAATPQAQQPYTVYSDATLGFVAEAPCAAAARGFDRGERAELVELADGGLVDDGETLVVAHPASLTELSFSAASISDFGAPTKWWTDGSGAGQKCHATWAPTAFSDGRRLAKWMAAVSDPAHLPRDAEQSSRWSSSANARAVAGVLMFNAAKGTVQERLQALRAAGKNLAGLSSSAPAGWPSLAQVGGLIQALRLPDARQALLGAEFADLGGVVCDSATMNAAVCTQWREMDGLAVNSVRAAAQPAILALVNEVTKDRDLNGLQVTLDSQPAQMIDANLPAKYHEAAAIVAPTGAAPNKALADRLSAYRANRLGAIAAKVAEAKRTAAEEKAKEARAVAAEKANVEREKAKEDREAAQEEKAEKAELEKDCWRMYHSRCPTEKETRKMMKGMGF